MSSKRGKKTGSGSKTAKKFIPSGKNSKAKKDIRNIIFKDINDDYAWGKYGNFKVIMMKENGYINATKLCSDAMVQTGSKKPFKNWKANSNTKELIDVISSDIEISASELLIPITTSSKNLTIIRGTYSHPDLIPHIASWASVQFAVKVSKIVNEYFTKKVLKEKEKLIEKKDDKIANLTGKVDELLNGNKQLLSKNDKMDKRIKRLLVKNDELYDQNEEILGKVDTISNDRVVSTGNPDDNHMLIIIKNNDNPEEYDDDEDIYEYHALRVMKKSHKQRLAAHKNRHPNMIVIMKILYSPNSINLWMRIKSKLSKGKNKKIFCSSSKFNLRKKYTQKQLMADVHEIHNERLNYDDDIDDDE